MKNILCFVYDSFVDYEISLVCTEINLDENCQVIYISYQNSYVKSSAGLKLKPDKIIAEIESINDFNGLIITGGYNRELKTELEQLMFKLNNEKKLIAAICGGPEFLAKAGILNGRNYTTSMPPNEYEEQGEKDPFPRETFIDSRMVRDDNIITAKGHAFVDFTLEIWEWLDLYENETEREECKRLYTPN
ncbi:hypothetical protein LCGC14_0634570 [marine sediment metagenome]|uniref:DJ-1/PfpI domain-containing protein n=1 Tax=marine sediment metagenome TaxID=412755 RepID=A0A0F9R0Z8_9ZZZZ